MAHTQRKRTRGAPRAEDQRWAELADLTLIVAREIAVRRYTDPRAQHLTQSEGTVMRYLQGAPDAAPSQIAAATGLQRTNLSTVLKALEKKGLIERHASPGDARGVRVHLTQAGRTNYTIVRHEWAEAVHAAANDDTTNLDAALALLTTVKDGLTKMRPTNRGTSR